MPQSSAAVSKVHSQNSTKKITTAGDKNLAKCANQRVMVSTKSQKPGTYSRVLNKPIFRHPAISKLSKKNYSTTKTCPSTFRLSSASPRCRKSQSLINLSPLKNGPQTDHRLEGGASPLEMERVTEKNKKLSTDDDNEFDSAKKAAGIVSHVLIVNAWRRRREDAVELNNTIEKLSQQVDHLQLQIVVLRRLLTTENNRVGKLGSEVHRTKIQLENMTKQKDTITEEKNGLEVDHENLKKQYEEKGVYAENLKNELMSVKNQLDAVDNQMTKEREKLHKLQEDKKILLEKISTSEMLTKERDEKVENVEKIIDELEEKCENQSGIIDNLQEDKLKLARELKIIKIEKVKLEKCLSSSEEIGKALSLRVENLETQLSDREAALRRIESAYNLQLVEIDEYRERSLRQSQENRWSSKVLQIAGSVVWAPRAIFRTLSFLSPGGLPPHP